MLDCKLASTDHLEKVTRFQNEQLVGAKMSDFEKIITRGGNVIVVCAVDRNRVECLIEVCRQGIVTYLLIDRTIAEKLSTELTTYT